MGVLTPLVEPECPLVFSGILIEVGAGDGVDFGADLGLAADAGDALEGEVDASSFLRTFLILSLIAIVPGVWGRRKEGNEGGREWGPGCIKTRVLGMRVCRLEESGNEGSRYS